MISYRRTVVVSLLVVLVTAGGLSGTATAATHDYCVESAAPTVVGSDSYDGLESDYCDAASGLDNATADLNETITAFEEGEGTLAAANQTLTTVAARHDELGQQESAVIGHLIDGTDSGEIAGGFDAMQAVEDDSRHRTESVAATADSYRTVLESQRGGPQLTVQLSLFGSLGGGLVVGLLVGAAVPIIAARRIEDKMKLSRDVSYDNKVAIVPVLIGIVLAIAGAVVLYQLVGLSDLLVVIR